MAQFDVFRNARSTVFPLLLDIQAEVISARLDSRIVVPVMQRKKYPTPTTRLHPVVTIDGIEHVMLFHELAAIPAAALGNPIYSLARYRNEFIAALDLLFTGS